VVEGAQLATSLDDQSEHGVDVAQDFARWNPQDFEPIAAQQHISRAVTTWLVASIMRLSIDFDD
jgi:hypothetical protein